MPTITLARFLKQLGGVFQKTDETGFVRTWGHLVANGNVLTFWRHAPEVGFSLMFLESYQRTKGLVPLEEQKLARGYVGIDFRSRKARPLVRTIHHAYLSAIEEDNFHFVPQRPKAAA
jgi:hypothetical protein